MKTQAYIVILTVLAFLASSGLRPALAAEGPAAPPLKKAGKEEKHQYNYFLFVRDNRGNGVAKTDTLVMAKVTPDGFELKDLCTKIHLVFGVEPLCMAGGKVHLLKTDDLISIDIATGECCQIASAVGPHCFDSGRLYFFAYRPDDHKIWVYDFHKGAYREIISIPSVGWARKTIAVSPDHKRLAYFDTDFSRGSGFLLNVVDIEAKRIEHPCPLVQYICGSGGFKFEAPPFVWLDAESILFVRWDRNKRANLIATANVLTGEMKDIVTLPGEPQRLRFDLLPPRNLSAAHLLLHEGPPRSDYGYYARGQYRIDLEAGKLIEDDSIGGEYHLFDLKGAEGLYHRARLIEEGKGVRQLAVSPDGKRIIWRSGNLSKSKLCYYDTKGQTVRTVTKGWFGHSYLWFAEEDLRPRAEAPEIPAGWMPFASQPWPPPRPADTRKDINDYLTFSLSCDKKRYRLHEPIRLTFTITNKSDIDFEMLRPCLHSRSVDLDIKYPWGSGGPQVAKKIKPTETIILKAGATISEAETLEAPWEGKYKIDGELNGVKKALNHELHLRGHLEANTISFTVESSPDAEELLESKMKELLAKVREEYARAPDDVSAPLFTMTPTLSIMRQIGPSAGPYLISFIKQESDERFIWALYKPLVLIASPEALPFYQECLKRRDARVRRMACLGLFELHRQGTSVADEALEALLASLGSDPVDVRRTVAKLLGRIYDGRVKRRFEAAVTDEDETVSTAAARYLAAYEGLALAEWLVRAAEEPTHARYLAAKSIIRQVEDDWHMKKSILPSAPWSDVSKSPEMLAQFRQTLFAWQEWAMKNPRASSRFFDKDRRSWPGPRDQLTRLQIVKDKSLLY